MKPYWTGKSRPAAIGPTGRAASTPAVPPPRELWRTAPSMGRGQRPHSGLRQPQPIQPPEYGSISWTIQAKPKQVLVIHPLHPSRVRGRRPGPPVRGLCRGAWPPVRAVGSSALTPMRAMPLPLPFYPKLGYRLAGSAEFFFEGFARENLICFEKGSVAARTGRRETAGRARLRRLCLPPLQRRQKLHKLRPCLLLREL